MNRILPIYLAALALLIGCVGEGEKVSYDSESRESEPTALKGETVSDPDETLLFAFYNVENLFDADDDPDNGWDNEYTPEGKNRWTESRLSRKLTNLARAIRSMGENNGPDIIGLAEVENRAVLERLTEEFLPKGVYRIIHAESPDTRGIDVALLYKPSVVEAGGMVMHRVKIASRRPTRDIMEATFRKGEETFTVLVNHWPSRAGGQQKSEPNRLMAAEALAEIVDSLTALDPYTDIVVMGDFNDEPSNVSISERLDAAECIEGEAFTHRLINTGAPVEAADTIGSYYYRGDWNVLDQILLSPGALDGRGLVLHQLSQEIFAPDFLRDPKSRAESAPPYRTFRGFYIGGFSDHFPVLLTVGWNNSAGQ